jgi:DNA-binding transcriptional MerR regulator
MKIKDVSQQTGLTKKTIRFYEAEGLIAPKKTWQNGREYRDYSQEDIGQLLKIATLRRARFSLEEIRHIQTMPEETAAVFSEYRQRLRDEQKDLAEILSVADAIAPEKLTSPDALISQMEQVAASMSLPTLDIHPHFRYLDDLEELMNMRKRNKVKLTNQEQQGKNLAARNAAMYAGFSIQNTPGSGAFASKGGGFDISNAQKVAAYNLLMNTKDDD